jgi:hypothetical protein
MRIPWKRIVQVAVLLLALSFMAALVRRQWAALQNFHWQLAPGWAVVALAGLELAWLLELGTWRRILIGLGGYLRYRDAGAIWFLSNIIRYIPGNVWQFLGMAELAAERGVPRLVTLTSIVLHQAISTAAGLVLTALYFAVAGVRGNPLQGVGAEWIARLRLLLLFVPLGLLLLQPHILERMLNQGMRRLGRPPLRVTFTWGQIWILLLRYAVVWLVMGLSFAALVRAMAPVTLDDVPYLVASWAAAYVIGYLSLLTPSGLGVREGILALLLTAIMPAPVAAVTAIIARLWMVVGELAGGGVALVIWRRGGALISTPLGAKIEESTLRKDASLGGEGGVAP